jgi:hypothetical protein
MNVTQHMAQNWCIDPYGRHEARWFSRGLPTALVRDRGLESQDPPPETAFGHCFTVIGYVDQLTPAGRPEVAGPARPITGRVRPRALPRRMAHRIG